VWLLLLLLVLFLMLFLMLMLMLMLMLFLMLKLVPLALHYTGIAPVWHRQEEEILEEGQTCQSL
jgi:hypothetical protein